LDALGSVRVVFDASGTVLTRVDYTPFGAEVVPAAGLPDQRFAGLFRDPEAGLDYAQARMYQVRTGRFNRPDPVYAGMFDPQRWNRYSYAPERLLRSPAGGLTNIPAHCNAR
jgi:RHS repeat-associated protein